MTDTPQKVLRTVHSRPPQGMPRWWVVVALALMIVGWTVQQTPLNRAWMLAINGAAWLPDLFWAGATLLAFGWATLILVSVADRGVEGGRAVLLAFVMGGLLSQAVKAYLAYPRPGLVLPDGVLHFIGNPVLHSGSMPSGHAMAALTIGALWVCLSRQRAYRPVREALLWTTAGLMALSRVAVGAHWPSDVLVGAGLGLWVAWFCWQVQIRWVRGRLAMSPGLVVAVELLAAWVAFTADEGYPQVLWLQWALGLLALASAGWRVWVWRQRPGVTAA